MRSVNCLVSMWIELYIENRKRGKFFLYVFVGASRVVQFGASSY
jgi:hypothetical protein